MGFIELGEVAAASEGIIKLFRDHGNRADRKRARLKYVMKDESRHVAFGVLSLRGYYDDLIPSERRDREDFIIYACELMRDRLIGTDIADLMGWNPNEVRDHVLSSPPLQMFRRMLFARIVPNLKKLDLLTPRVREAFDRLGILQFEDFDAEAMDKQLGFA